MKKDLTPLEIYNKRKKTAKILKIIAPIVFWLLLTLSFVCLYFALKNSIGNVREMLDMLDGDKYTSDILEQHYEILVEKYGIWNIGSGGTGFQMKFIDIKKVLFNGFSISNGFASVVFLVSAYTLGKFLLPRLSKQIAESNQDDAITTVLKKQEKE